MGVFLMPVIPGITDKAEKIEQTVCSIKNAGAQFILFGGMTLKKGRQQDHFYNVLHANNSELKKGYGKIYRSDNKWGAAVGKYYERLEHRFWTAAKKHQIPRRIPVALFKDICSPSDLVQVVLGQLDYLQRSHGAKVAFSKLAGKIACLEPPLRAQNEVVNHPNISPNEAAIVEKIIADPGGDLYTKYQW